MQPPQPLAPAPIEASTTSLERKVALLSLGTAGCVLIGWFVPYLSGIGSSTSLSDGESSADLAVLAPAAIAIVTAILGMQGRRWCTALSAGAAASVAAFCLVFAGIFYEFVSSLGDFADVDYGLGFYVHALAIAGGVGLLAACVALVREHDDEPVAAPITCLLAIAGIVAFGVGVLLPHDDLSIFDVPSGPIKAAYVGWVVLTVAIGIVGFGSRRPTGLFVGLGAAVTCLLSWISMATADTAPDEFFATAWIGGNRLLIALGAIAALVFGAVAVMASGASSATAVDAPRASVPMARVASGAPGWRIGGDPVELDGPPPTAPAGWYPDPSGRAAQRWWDGLGWTEHVTGTDQPDAT